MACVKRLIKESFKGTFDGVGIILMLSHSVILTCVMMYGKVGERVDSKQWCHKVWLRKTHHHLCPSVVVIKYYWWINLVLFDHKQHIHLKLCHVRSQAAYSFISIMHFLITDNIFIQNYAMFAHKQYIHSLAFWL